MAAGLLAIASPRSIRLTGVSHRERARSYSNSRALLMKRYEKFADDIAELIRSGVLGPGQRVPSVRYASQTYGVSPSTVFQA